MSGPVPKRSEERRRRNSPASERVQTTATEPLAWPEPEPGWHPTATRWYQSLQRSGQAQFFEPSDVALAVYTAELMTISLSGERGAATVAGTVKTLMDDLLTSEGSRRRARLELEKPSGDEGKQEEDELAAFRARKAEGQ